MRLKQLLMRISPLLLKVSDSLNLLSEELIVFQFEDGSWLALYIA